MGQFTNVYPLINVFLQIWCWSCHSGAALLKMSAFPKEQDDSTSQMQKAFLDGSVIAILSTTLCLVWTLLLFFHICYIFKLAHLRRQVLDLKVVFCSEMGLSLWPALVSCAGLNIAKGLFAEVHPHKSLYRDSS